MVDREFSVNFQLNTCTHDLFALLPLQLLVNFYWYHNSPAKYHKVSSYKLKKMLTLP